MTAHHCSTNPFAHSSVFSLAMLMETLLAQRQLLHVHASMSSWREPHVEKWLDGRAAQIDEDIASVVAEIGRRNLWDPDDAEYAAKALARARAVVEIPLPA